MTDYEESILEKATVEGIDYQAFAQGYIDMGELNLKLSNEMFHLENEADVK